MWVFRERVSRIFNRWELRVMVVVSLLLQVILISLGNRRKHDRRDRIRFILWLCYLSADWVATASLGVLSSSQDDPNYVIMPIWAPFLLLHLGGQDTITAYSLEDNELWHRHFLGLIVQLVLTLDILLRSLQPTSLNWVVIPVLIAGIIKYGERTWVLRSASSEHFRESLLPSPDPGPSYAKFMDEYILKENEGFVLTWRMAKAPRVVARNYELADDNSIVVPDADILNAAYDFFLTYKRLFADLILSFQDLEKSQSFFQVGPWEKAFKVIEVELGFMYDLLYTKAVVIHSRRGYFLRCTTLSSMVVALGMFCDIDRRGYSSVNVVVTFLLLVGAVCLELFAFLLLVSSDWALLWFSNHTSPLVNFIYRTISCVGCINRKKKWSNSVGQYSLISSCLKARHTMLMQNTSMHKMIDNYQHTSSKGVPLNLKEFIFHHLAGKSKSALDLRACKKFCENRGEQVLEKNNCLDKFLWSVEVEFDESILLWHIATDLCYFSDPNSGTPDPRREVSKLLSDYMLYILVNRPFMLPNGIGQIRFQDTCAEAKEFFQDRKTVSDEKIACQKLLQVEIKISPAEVKGDRSKSLLFHACKLAKSLQLLEDNEVARGNQKKWEMVSDVWVEMLSYAASQCTSNHHAQQLRRGGELLTHTWLLMAHLGLTQQFQISQGHARTKLIVQ